MLQATSAVAWRWATPCLPQRSRKSNNGSERERGRETQMTATTTTGTIHNITRKTWGGQVLCKAIFSNLKGLGDLRGSKLWACLSYALQRFDGSHANIRITVAQGLPVWIRWKSVEIIFYLFFKIFEQLSESGVACLVRKNATSTGKKDHSALNSWAIQRYYGLQDLRIFFHPPWLFIGGSVVHFINHLCLQNVKDNYIVYNMTSIGHDRLR